jgi:hypothetical protein
VLFEVLVWKWEVSCVQVVQARRALGLPLSSHEQRSF